MNDQEYFEHYRYLGKQINCADIQRHGDQSNINNLFKLICQITSKFDHRIGALKYHNDNLTTELGQILGMEVFSVHVRL